jgi:hypothetical protein
MKMLVKIRTTSPQSGISAQSRQSRVAVMHAAQKPRPGSLNESDPFLDNNNAENYLNRFSYYIN